MSRVSTPSDAVLTSLAAEDCSARSNETAVSPIEESETACSLISTSDVFVTSLVIG